MKLTWRNLKDWADANRVPDDAVLWVNDHLVQDVATSFEDGEHALELSTEGNDL